MIPRLPVKRLPFPARAALVGWGVATLLWAALLAAQVRLFFGYALVGAAVYFGVLALLAVPVWRFCDVLARRRFRWWSAALLHLGVGALVIAVWHGIHFGFLYWVAGPEPVRQQIVEGGLWQLFTVVVMYALLVATIVAYQSATRLRRQRDREGELRLLAREAELKGLQAQVRPHFLFNVLNSIYAVIPTRPDQAQEMVLQLARLLQGTLDTSDTELIPLQRELELARTYLAIEQVRLGDRLTVHWHIDDDARPVQVPPLLLQPLIENAVKHGVAAHPEPGAIEICAHMEGHELLVSIADSGVGKVEGLPEEEGHGLAITRRRLVAAYGDAGRLDIAPRAAHGVEARLSIPLVAMESEE